ncbi:LOW QUALITY PROTEIN: protein ZGRF1-like [Lytechinus variegatus]|uniref:LOW QUALITY PROTEIN: protein ZGRF1-like n=1 Tax=Lytechinus variegatus TaxID=7654 RepID=UPI001BB144A3|nr:LOW QUALITY PROTEIN: protein ZGRF1-like [Lytechinus variegatus]
MAAREYIVLYTHQKRKKAKVWQDGVLKISEQGTKAVLIGEGNKRLDQVHIKVNQAAIGEELESEKYLINIEEIASSDTQKSEPLSHDLAMEKKPDHILVPPAQVPRRQPLKRKRTGFVPPRQVNKRPSPEKDNPQQMQGTQNVPRSTGFGSPRSSLFSSPFSNTGASSQGPDILNMYGKSTVKSSQSNMAYAVSNPQIQNAVRSKAPIYDPNDIKSDFEGESQEWNSDYNKTSSSHNADAGFSPHPEDMTAMALDVSGHRVENQLQESFKINVTGDPPRTKSCAGNKSENLNVPGSTNQTLVRTSLEHQGDLSVGPGRPGMNLNCVETRLQGETKAHAAAGAKRSTSRILALLGKGNKSFQPPLKQNTTQSEVANVVTHPSTVSAGVPSSQTISIPQQPVHTSLDNYQETGSSAEPLVAEQAVWDNPLSHSTESHKSDSPLHTSRELRIPPLHRTSHNVSIRSENNLMRANIVSDQNSEAWHNKTGVHDEPRIAQGNPVLSQNQHQDYCLPEEAVNRRQHVLSLHHLHHANLNGDGTAMGKSGSQTQSGDVFPEGVGGRGRKKGFRTPVSVMSNIGMHGELNFPAADTVHSGSVPQRKITIPVSFPSASSYKQVLTEAVKEHLNILLYELSHRYHSTMEKADITPYTKTHHSGDPTRGPGGGGLGNPPCKHGQPAKMVCVKKDGPNKGRMFYVCNNQRENQCKFFVWADQHSAQASQAPTQPSQSRAKISLHNAESIEKFARTHQVHLYCECQLSRRGSLNEGPLGSAPSWIKKYRAQQLNNTTKKLYIKLDRKEHSSTYAKDDLWIVSQDLTFDPACSFVAKSMFHGPSSTNEIEIEPLTGYSPSNWSRDGAVYGILACNASSELTCLENLQEYVNPRTFPILPHLISCEPEKNPSFHGPAFVKPARSRHLNLPSSLITELVEDTIRSYHLNPDQSLALQQVSSMLEEDNPPVTLIHGVFGAGKSYLLAVMVLFLIKLFNLHEENEPTGQDGGWKVLIASTTNVAVDRILLGLLELGFEDFIRVGSLRKIAKPVLPYSVHASDKENQEMKELQEMLKGDLTQSEKQLVRRSIERQRLGKNKEMLSKVKVIGVTCAACSFPCIKNLKFPVVLLDECSQMTEPSSLLPMARFGCEKLVLVGDPHQLDPTIQGSESAHKSGLEQTLFDRLSLMGYDPIMLRTQYRCHPCISSIANTLFYDGQLLDGVIEEDRPPLLPNLPTLCFFNISHGREMSSRDGSYFNDPEASFVVFLISSMMEMGISPSDVGVITLYKAQVSRIRMLLQTSSTQKSSELKAIQISTVDAFQGGEKSIIILSCVRTQRVGFIDSDKRTNVALTRSKNHLLIVGGMKMLSDNHLWGEIIHKCQEHPGGIQDSKVFQKKWEERLRELKQDVDPEPEKRPRRTRGKRRKLERNEREHSPAMSLDSDDDDDDFVSSVSPCLSGTSKDHEPDTSGQDCSKNTIPLPPGSPHSTLGDDDLVCVDLSTPPEDVELSNTRSRMDAKEPAPVPDATSVASHLAPEVDHPLRPPRSFPVDDDLSSVDPPDPQFDNTTRLKMDYAESEAGVSSAVPGTYPGDNLTLSPRTSTEEDDLPSVDIGTRPTVKDLGNSKWTSEHKTTSFPGDDATLEECRDSVVQELVKTPEASFSYSPLEHVVESDSEESGEDDLPNFDIGNIFS